VLLGFATSWPHVPPPGSGRELVVLDGLYRLLAESAGTLGLPPSRRDCRALLAFVPAARTLGAPSGLYAARMRRRLLVARHRLGLRIRPSAACPVRLPPAA